MQIRTLRSALGATFATCLAASEAPAAEHPTQPAAPLAKDPSSAEQPAIVLALRGDPLDIERLRGLFRLGQAAAARRALEPFAAGEYGSYRREEARRLLVAA